MITYIHIIEATYLDSAETELFPCSNKGVALDLLEIIRRENGMEYYETENKKYTDIIFALDDENKRPDTCKYYRASYSKYPVYTRKDIPK